MNPINYSVDVADPLSQSLNAFQAGAGIQNVLAARQEAERKRALEIQMQTDLAALAGNKNPTAQDYSALMVKYPTMSEHFKRGWDTLDKAQQQTKLTSAMQVYSAVNSGRNDVAVDLLTEQATALRNSGNEKDAKASETMAEFIRLSPESAKTSVGLMLSAVMGPDKFSETFKAVGGERRADEEQPGKLAKLTAEAAEAKEKAKQAAVTSRFAESVAIKDLEKRGWDITKIQEDIKVARENSRIAAMNSDIAREGNQIRRQELELKRDEAVKKRDEDIASKTAEVTTARTNIDNFLNTADRILGTPDNVKRAAMGPLDSRLPTIQQDVADFEALMENFDAQAFISQLPSMKGLGALSNAEGQRLSSALQSFSLKQSPERLKDNVQEAQRLLQKARRNLVTRYGVPDTVPDTPAAATSTTPTQIDDLLKKYAP